MTQELIEEVIRFRDERNWKQFHNPKDLAISLSLEASELLENFQWSGSEESLSKNRDHIADELADVLMYCILFADVTGIDMETAIRNKLLKNKAKYPVEKAYGRKDKYTVYLK